MFKSILMSGVLCTILSAESFDIFLQKAIKNSPYLKSSALAIKQAEEQGKVLTRYSNPSLELEVSSLESAIGSSDSGYRVGILQPVRLWSIADNKKNLADANVENAKATYIQKKAIFIRDISLRYTLYIQFKMLHKLGIQELEIAKKIYDISTARFDSGTISKGVKLQAQLDFEMSKSLVSSLSLSAMNSYFDLLEFAGINEEIDIEEDHSFYIKKKKKNTQNPTISLLKTSQLQALSDAKVNSNSIEFIDLFAEIEKESDQDVFRVGVNIPLAFFNDKTQEKTIAILQANKVDYLIEHETNRLNMEQLKLQKEKKSLLKLSQENKRILKTQLELLSMYEDAYKIASVNLIQLQDIKNKVIRTKRALIQIDIALNQNAIYTQYNQGNYNE